MKVFKRGEEKQHPGQINSKKTKLAIERYQSVKTKLEAELQNKKNAAENVRSSIVNRLENEIMAIDKHFERGQKPSLLRKHVFLLESYCKKNLNGKIPPRHQIMSCLHEAVNAAETGSTSTMSRVKKRTCRENPFKECRENQGIVFPTSSQNKPSGANASDLYRTAPLTKSEEEEQLKMALSISARGPLESNVADTKTPLCESHAFLLR